MPSRTPSPTRSSHEKNVNSKHESFGSDHSPLKKTILNIKENENEKSENGNKELPILRGPEGGTIKYDIKELKRITVRIERSLPKQEVARKIIDPESIAPVRRPDEGKQPLFSRIALCGSSNSGEDQSATNKSLVGEKKRSRSRSPDYDYRHRSRHRSTSSSRKRYRSPSPSHYRHRPSSRHSPRRESSYYEYRKRSRRSHSSGRDRRTGSERVREHEQRRNSRSPSRHRERSHGEERDGHRERKRRSYDEDRDGHHESRRSIERSDRGHGSHGVSREPVYSSSRDHRYSHKNKLPDVRRPPHVLEPHPGMIPMGPMVMGPVLHPYPPFVPPVMVRPPPPGFRPHHFRPTFRFSKFRPRNS
uniref:SDP_N domain-containing protein n=2 Tax=Rhodnius prolixus TaxID=13249 RepID=T1I4F1_RHOPR